MFNPEDFEPYLDKNGVQVPGNWINVETKEIIAGPSGITLEELCEQFNLEHMGE